MPSLPSKTRRAVLLVLLLVAMATGIRLILIYRSRNQPWNVPQAPKVKLTADDYVVPRKLHAYDLASLRQLAGKPVWIRSGYQLPYFPYSTGAKRADLEHKAGVLGPIEKLDIKDVIEQPTPEKLQWQSIPGSKVRVRVRSRELVAVFEKDGKPFAFTLGYGNGAENTIAADEILYYQDPHELYQHWPAEIWSAVDRHQAQPGMNELQVQFAIGGAAGLESYNDSQRVLIYENDGKPLRVTFVNGKAQTIEPVSP